MHSKGSFKVRAPTVSSSIFYQENDRKTNLLLLSHCIRVNLLVYKRTMVSTDRRLLWAKTISNILSILIDIINLGEVIAIYFVVNKQITDEAQQRRFFFIFLGISASPLFKPIFPFESLKTIYSIIVEVLEFVFYLNLSNKTEEINKVAGVFLALEIFFHLLALFFAFYIDYRDGCSCVKCGATCCCSFCVGIPLYLAINVPPILQLFLQSESDFRSTYYEILTILNLWFGTSALELADQLLSRYSTFKEFDWDEVRGEIVKIVWEIIRFVCSVILVMILSITGMIIASNAIRNHMNGQNTLKFYDLFVYILTLVQTSSGILSLAVLICVGCGFGCFALVTLIKDCLK